MSIMVIDSEHNLQRDKLPLTPVRVSFGPGLSFEEPPPPHKVWCDSCKVGPMTLDQAREHASVELGTGRRFVLYTL